MKKILSLLLVIALLFCMSACSATEISLTKVYSEFSKAGYSIEEDYDNYYSAEDIGFPSRIVTNVSSGEVWRELDSGASDWGQVALVEFTSADDARYAMQDLKRDDWDGYDTVDITESKNATRVILYVDDYSSFAYLCMMNNTILCLVFDYDDFEDVGVTYDFLPLEIMEKLGY